MSMLVQSNCFKNFPNLWKNENQYSILSIRLSIQFLMLHVLLAAFSRHVSIGIRFWDSQRKTLPPKRWYAFAVDRLAWCMQPDVGIALNLLDDHSLLWFHLPNSWCSLLIGPKGYFYPFLKHPLSPLIRPHEIRHWYHLKWFLVLFQNKVYKWKSSHFKWKRKNKKLKLIFQLKHLI